MSRFAVCLAGLLSCMAFPTSVAAQPLGTLRWQLQPFCNIVSVAVTQNGAVYRLEGTDDQCGNGADQASVTGTAFLNADGTIGFGLNIVTTPGGRPLHVEAEISIATLSGTWRDSAGATGAFTFTPAAGSGGSPRPLPSGPIPPAIQFRSDGGFVAVGDGDSAIPATGQGVRMMWYPGKAAFRAGSADGTDWDDANVGNGSVAFGTGTMASGSASVAMGSGTTASGLSSVAMGSGTTASGLSSTALGLRASASGTRSVAMGQDTIASGTLSVATGYFTTASGLGSVAGGVLSEAEGDLSLAFGDQARAGGRASVALGRHAFAVGDGSFVFADSTNAQFAALGANEFNVRASGGVQIFSNAAASLGVALAPNATQWSVLSDARTKQRHRTLDGEDVLGRIARMPITEWGYKEQDAAIRHIGPTAQDFHAAFGLGEDPLRIGTLDADGVALAGVKAVEARTRDMRAHHDRLLRRVEALERALAEALELVRALKDGGR